MNLLACPSLGDFIIGVMLSSAGGICLLGMSIAAFVATFVITSRHSS